MSGKTISDHVADILRERNAGSPRASSDDFRWRVDCGDLDVLHDAYRRSLDGGPHRLSPREGGVRGARAIRERHAVTEALARTARGRELFRCERFANLYPGIVNGVARVFTLKPEFREEEPARE